MQNIPVSSAWAQKSSLWPLLEYEYKTLICPLLRYVFSLRLQMILLLELYSFVATRHFYLSLFDLMIGAFLDVIFRNKTHVNIWILM